MRGYSYTKRPGQFYCNSNILVFSFETSLISGIMDAGFAVKRSAWNADCYDSRRKPIRAPSRGLLSGGIVVVFDDEGR